ncbi:MAG: riboflavin kinase [Patescibacteria group bacterium]|nr:riboflavin kinase [Patescibacteria group bacterium]
MQLPVILRGRAVSGRGVGATLGVPTVNLDTVVTSAVAGGVYCCWVFPPSGAGRPGVAHLGPAVTFGQTKPTLEVHFLDGAGVEHGTTLAVQLVVRLRGTIRFADAAALTARLQQDLAQAREYFRSAPPPDGAAGLASGPTPEGF